MILLEQLTVHQLDNKNFSAFYGTTRLIAVFARACRLSQSLTWTRPIQSTPSHIFLRYTLILSSHLVKVFQVVSIFPISPPKLCMHLSTYDVPQSKPSVPLGNMSINYGEKLLRPYPVAYRGGVWGVQTPPPEIP